ncbi:MAG: class I SAM-dependent methyltransferase [Proteobacteria bacterium]|nr:class I SAM-dependent methyltransferase [Pseudomonadota bacterium]
MIELPDTDKWNRIYQKNKHDNLQAARVLVENQHLLPTTGRALDAACGLAANARLLAGHGLQTHAWDISNEAIDRIRKSIKGLDIQLTLQQRDIVTNPPDEKSFDVIVVSRFLDRHLVKHLIAALRQDGLIFYQTFIKHKKDDVGPGNPHYLLDDNELLVLFRPLHIVLYREEGKVGNLDAGFRNEAMLIAQRRL